jgi:hypothetical protein
MVETPQRLAKESSLLNLWGVVPGHDQKRRGVVGTDACQGDQLRGDLRHQLIEVSV